MSSIPTGAAGAQTARTSLPPAASAAIYTAAVMLLSAPFWVIVARAGIHGSMGVLGLMWCPAAAALLSALVTRRPIRAFGWRLPGFGYVAAAYVIPLVYAAAAYGAVWALGLGRIDTVHYQSMLHRSVGSGLALIATLGVAIGCVSALGEEIGWRGFLVPVLAQRFGLTATSLISGVIWAAWHVPVIIFGDYNGGTPAWYSVTCFAAAVLGISFVMAWLRLASGSLWPCMLLHAAHNSFVQDFFTPLTGDTGHTAWFIDEFGAFLPVAIIAAAVITLSRTGLRLRSPRQGSASF